MGKAAVAIWLGCLAQLQGGTLLIRNVKVFDGARMMPATSVLVVDGRINMVKRGLRPGTGVEVVDGTGKYLLPGLIDAHVHIQSRDDLKAAARYGVTTYLDMFTLQELAASIRARQEEAGAELFSAGTLITAPGGHGTEYGVPIPTLARAVDAQAFVDARIAERSDYIKLVKDNGSAFRFRRPTLDEATLAAAIQAAHRRKKLAVVHIATGADAREALKARADVLAHVPAGEFDAAAARGVAWAPTLVVVTAQGGPQMSDAVRRMKSEGVVLLAGTDAPNPGTKHGESLHDEMELLVKAGLTPVESLAAATSRPAAVFGLKGRGRIAPGMRADLVLVDGDPSVDIRATRKITAVWKSGIALKQ